MLIDASQYNGPLEAVYIRNFSPLFFLPPTSSRVLGSGNTERDLLSSPSSRQIFEIGECISDEPLSSRARGNMERGEVVSSYSSMEDRSAEDVVVEVGERAGDWTISCRKEGRSGAGACTDTDGKLKSLLLEGILGIIGMVALFWA